MLCPITNLLKKLFTKERTSFWRTSCLQDEFHAEVNIHSYYESFKGEQLLNAIRYEALITQQLQSLGKMYGRFH